MAECLIAFGSNQGDSSTIYRLVSGRFHKSADFVHVATSEPISTAPIGGPEGQPAYLNGIFRIGTPLSPVDLHRRLIEFEVNLGRQRRERWGARSVDLDLLLVGDQVVMQTDLVIPHPRMSFRRFVLEPASEIASEMVHPTSGLTIGSLLDRINQPENYLQWQTDNRDQAREIIERCGDILSDWTITFCESLRQIGCQTPKLVIRDIAHEQSPTGAPTLDLNGCSPELMQVEIKAAIEAMA